METQLSFIDRRDAGRHLADHLVRYRASKPLVLALPRGGVPVGFEIARTLGAPLDVIIARKLGAPSQPELGIGAVAPGGVLCLDEALIDSLGVSQQELDEVVRSESEEMWRRLRHYRGDAPPPDVRGRTVIVTDDGLATGVTASAAIEAVRRMDPAAVVLAVPVCAPESARALSREVDDFVCVLAPHGFRAVGLWYDDFDQTTDAEVLELLEEARGFATLPSLTEG